MNNGEFEALAYYNLGYMVPPIPFVPDMDMAGQNFAGKIRQAFGNKAIISAFDYRFPNGELKDSGEFDRNEVKEYLINVKNIRDGLRPL